MTDYKDLNKTYQGVSFDELSEISEPHALPSSIQRDRDKHTFGREQTNNRARTEPLQNSLSSAFRSHQPPPTQQWLDQLQEKGQGTFWIHLPPHNAESVLIGMCGGELFFAPCCQRRPFLDETFREQQPELTAKILKHTEGARSTHQSLLTETQLGPLSDNDRHAMTEMLYRLIDQVARKYGVSGFTMEFSKLLRAPEHPVSFHIDAIRAHATKANTLHQVIKTEVELHPGTNSTPEDLSWFYEITQHAQSAWLTTHPINTVTVTHSVPNTAMTHSEHVKSLVRDLAQQLNIDPSTARLWTGGFAAGHWCVLFKRDVVAVFRVDPHKLAMLMPALSTLCDPIPE